MTQNAPRVDWYDYARKYDMLLQYNPFYQALRQEVLDLTDEWQIEAGDIIADIGAGTGNYSLALARQFPASQVLHIDKNHVMNRWALEKQKAARIDNLKYLPEGIEKVEFAENSLRAIISIHALYTFPDPHAVLANMHRWLQPGGMGILVDPGRIVRVFNWQLAIGWHLLTQHGLAKTLEIMREAKTVSKQNRLLSQMQRRGELWTHTPEAFQQAVEQAGFTILESRRCFRGISDLAVVTRK